MTTCTCCLLPIDDNGDCVCTLGLHDACTHADDAELQAQLDGPCDNLFTETDWDRYERTLAADMAAEIREEHAR